MTNEVNPSLDHKQDRNFDEVADHFANKVYGGLKGDIRLAVLRRDLLVRVEQKSEQLQRPLRILDIGAGLAQISTELASLGHELTINDISANMLAKAKAQLDPQYATNIQWLICPYQDLAEQLQGKYDVILCHALLEWLAEPKKLLEFSKDWLGDNGLLSLCFYNPASFVYRNLIMGNFNLLNNPNYRADNKKSLTPNHPVDKEEVFSWLDEFGFVIETVSGLRVFHDYSPLKRGGHNHPEEVLKMEVKYSNQEPFKWMGRYLHVLARAEKPYSQRKVKSLQGKRTKLYK